MQVHATHSSLGFQAEKLFSIHEHTLQFEVANSFNFRFQLMQKLVSHDIKNTNIHKQNQNRMI